MHPNFHLGYGIFQQVQNAMITLQKEQENSLKISFLFPCRDKIAIYVCTRGHWDCITLQQYCTTFSFESKLYRSASGWYNLNAHG